MNRGNDIYQTIADYLSGDLTADERQRLEERLAADPELRNMVTMVERLRRDLEESDWSAVSGPVHELVARQLRDIRKARLRPNRAQGVLTFDSKLLPLPDGVRPAAVDTRRLKFQIGDTRLDMSLYPVSAGSYELIGQMSDWPFAENLTVVLTGSGASFSEEGNQFQLFRFARVPTGRYVLKVKRGRRIFAEVELEL